MRIEKAKQEIDKQFLKAIYSKTDLNNVHPMRVIQALKSLIGLDMNNPSEHLILWGKNYLKDKKSLPKNYFKYTVLKPKETIVLSDLTEQILLKDKKKSILEIQDLCSVSDGNQIFEFLIEFAAAKNNDCISFIWSAYRANMFLGNKYKYPLLYLSVIRLFDESLDNKEFNFMFDIESLFIQESIKKQPLTRQSRINQYLNDVDINKLNDYEERDVIDVLNDGRSAILHYLNALDLELINEQIILFLDSCRMIFKDSSKNCYPKINNIMNYVLESELC